MGALIQTEKIIEPADYTPKIEQVIAALEHRMQSTLVEYSTDDIIVVEYDDITYILANPVLGKEALYDESGDVEELMPIHNFTTIWANDWLSYDHDRQKFVVKEPRISILRPDLCVKILPDGTVIDGGNAFDTLCEMAGVDQ